MTIPAGYETDSGFYPAEDHVGPFYYQIECDIPINVTLQDLTITPRSKDDINRFCDEMKFAQRIRDRVEKLF